MTTTTNRADQVLAAAEVALANANKELARLGALAAELETKVGAESGLTAADLAFLATHGIDAKRAAMLATTFKLTPPTAAPCV